MIKYKVNDYMVPPLGGWRYIQPETGFTIKGQNHYELFKAIKDHRVANNLPVGDVQTDFEDFACAAQPVGSTWCSPILEGDDINLKRHFTTDDMMRFVNSVVSVLADGKLVEKDVAEKRAEICSYCPLNTRITGCWSCIGLAEKIYNIIGTRATSRDATLNQCGVCGCSLKAKVWLPIEIARKTVEGMKFPSFCWLKTED
jgi:hypothetical protein